LDASELLAGAVPVVARAVAAQAMRKGSAQVNERDDLQPIARDVLKELAARQPDPVQVQTSFPLAFPDWPRLGNVDIALSAQHRLVFLELKCGSDRDALGPCAWDVLKCAFALRQGIASYAYLLAATTRALWQFPIRGAKFFTARHAWTVTELRTTYEDWWRKWEREGYSPLRVPAQGATEFVAEAPVQSGAVEWEIRLTQVWSDDGDWHNWPRFGST
jgi:hypothetical protein